MTPFLRRAARWPFLAVRRLRWARGADRESTYLNVRNPMRGGAASSCYGMAPAC